MIRILNFAVIGTVIIAAILVVGVVAAVALTSAITSSLLDGTKLVQESCLSWLYL